MQASFFRGGVSCSAFISVWFNKVKSVILSKKQIKGISYALHFCCLMYSLSVTYIFPASEDMTKGDEY